MNPPLDTEGPQRGGADSSVPRPTQPILRLLAAERMSHWALAAPFVLLYLSALMLALLYAEPQPRHLHTVFGIVHRVAGLALIFLPPLALLRGGADWRAHLDNMREGWSWTRDDLRWLLLFPLNAVNPRVALPEQGKFNAAEKLNFMMVSATYPFYIVTGLMVWLPGAAFFPYLAHLAVALLGLPLVLGHIFMATVNPSTRVGLSGMVTGWVDREWAKHHYRRWFRERIERPEREAAARMASLLARPSRVQCEACREVVSFGTWKQMLQRAFRVEPLACPNCNEPIHVVDAETSPRVAEAILQHLIERGADSATREPRDRQAA